jgi:hypothetical protein
LQHYLSPHNKGGQTKQKDYILISSRIGRSGGVHHPLEISASARCQLPIHIACALAI